MRVCFVSSEVVPFASTGGLGDVAAALPDALTSHGHDVFRIMPLYRNVWEGGYDIANTGLKADIPIGPRMFRAEFWVTEGKWVTPTFFVRRDEYFDRRELYSIPERDYSDNIERFLFFQKAAIALMDLLKKPIDIVHVNDWQTGLIPLYLKNGIAGLGRAGQEKTIFTIHNLAFQGIFPAPDFHLTNLPFSLYSVDVLEYYDKISFLKAGITSTDLVTTVSKTYAREIQTPENGCGFEGLLLHRGDHLRGIRNGIDVDLWNPATDRYLEHHYSATSLSGKAENKKHLLVELGLPYDDQRPLLGMVSRLSDQKGLDLIAQIMPELMSRDVQFVLLGKGQDDIQKQVEDWAIQHPDKFKCILGFDHEMAHRIEAASDIYLMPSRYEPCGLNQMYSLRYGAIPVVHATGGLEDTIVDLEENPGQGNGFKFKPYTAAAFLKKVDAALLAFRENSTWRETMTRGMLQDFSWSVVAKEYLDAYHGLLKHAQ